MDFDTADNCGLYVRLKETLSFQDDFPSLPSNKFQDHYAIVHVLGAKQDATENYRNPKLCR